MLKNQLLGDDLGSPLLIRMRPLLDMKEEQFFLFCQVNELLRIERTADGDLIIQPMASGRHGCRSSELGFQLARWTDQDGTGLGFGACTGFTLPNSAMRSPDAAWVRRERIAALTREQWQRFPPLCPDFVVELREDTEDLTVLQEKLGEYIDNGARLGWLIDPENRHVYIYRPNAPVQRLEDPAVVPGDPELPGFGLDAQAIFTPSF